MQISVIYNRPGTTSTVNIMEADEDTKKSAINIHETLNKMNHNANILEIGPEDIDSLADLQTDLVFNLVEWTGREYKLGVEVIKTLENSKIPFTGSQVWGYELTSDKVMMKQEMEAHNIPTPKWDTEVNEKLKFPVIVKPIFEHCGIGISQKSVVTNETDLRSLILDLRSKYAQPVLIEEYVDGLEAQVTVLEKNGAPWVLPPAILKYEQKPGYWGVLTYAAKWESTWETKMSVWVDPSPLSDAVLKKIESIALDCYTYLGGRGYPRADMRISGDNVYVLEINNNPGIDFDPASGITVAAKQAGLTWEGLLQNIIDNALITP